MTRGDLADLLILQLTQGKPSDDIEIEKDQVMALADIHRDGLVKEYLDKAILAGQSILDSQYVERLSGNDLTEETDADVDDEDERLYFTLPKQPLGLSNDMGVAKIVTDEGLVVLKAQFHNMDIFNDLRFAKPSPDNLVYWRDNLKIVIEGLSHKNKSSDQFIVYYVPAMASQTLTETDDLKISDAFLPELINQVETVLRRMMFGGVADNENDGSQPKVQPQKVD